MVEYAIRTEQISKLFLLGAIDSTRAAYSHRKQLLRMLPMMAGLPARESPDSVWAVRDIDVEIRPGEIVGLIGRNGCGKSTLLKILSRIVQPTRGRFEIHGRVTSLLEVGTGFHPDLTGRQNIFLSGSILGMHQREIARKFDEIVSFAEVERFIDTPVRHYSSGMYTRLAFAVSAHLDSDVLLVDEVLAVGDLQFQKKSLGRMKESMGSGKTVIFVSHNTASILQICNRCLWLDRGRLVADGTPVKVVEDYAASGSEMLGRRVWSESDAPTFEDRSVRMRSIELQASDGAVRSVFDVKESFQIEVSFDVMVQKHTLNVHLYFSHESTGRLFVSMDNLHSPLQDEAPPPGRYRAICRIPANLLSDGLFTVEYVICTNPTSTFNATYADAITFRITDDMEPGGIRGNWTREWPLAAIRPCLEWRHMSEVLRTE